MALVFVSYCPVGQGNILGDPTVLGVARKVGKTPAQVVLRWHMQQPGIAAIPKSSQRAHLAENLAVFDFALDDVDMKALSGLARRFLNGRIIRPATEPDWGLGASFLVLHLVGKLALS